MSFVLQYRTANSHDRYVWSWFCTVRYNIFDTQFSVIRTTTDIPVSIDLVFRYIIKYTYRTYRTVPYGQLDLFQDHYLRPFFFVQIRFSFRFYSVFFDQNSFRIRDFPTSQLLIFYSIYFRILSDIIKSYIVLIFYQ